MSRTYFDGGGTNYTKLLSEYSANLKYDKIPAEVIERAKLMTLHTLGVSLAAAPVELSGSAVRVGLAMNGGPGGAATSWLGGHKMSAANAAFVNGTLADMLDWEDCSWFGHPSAGTFPAALALAEELKKDGRSYLEAVVAALEIYMRVGLATQPAPDFNHNKGWGLTSWQIYASAAAAAKIMGFDAARTNQAYGMAALFCTISSNLTQGTMSNSYHYEHGMPAMAGVLGAYCVREGLDNLEGAFDSPYAFIEKMTDAPQRELLDKDLDKFLMMRILIKHWPANMWVQTPTEIILDLLARHKFKPEEVAEIIVDPPTQFRMHYYPEGFSSLMEAQFSMPYVMAAAMLDPSPGPNWYTREKMSDPRLLALAAKIKPGSSPEHTLKGSFDLFIAGDYPEKTVTVTMKDGSRYVGLLDRHKGHPDNMLSAAEFQDLFRHNARVLLKADRAERIIDYVMNIEKQSDLSGFGELLK
ncbi:MAG: MmgE/PrpD family protein [Candidatus Adiutrix sp.]|jgi:2-methylcitrate dehydratase PrpD|nr:MmgE/PrpD family protein [Candidatus Adiutrix sp.]